MSRTFWLGAESGPKSPHVQTPTHSRERILKNRLIGGLFLVRFGIEFDDRGKVVELVENNYDRAD